MSRDSRVWQTFYSPDRQELLRATNHSPPFRISPRFTPSTTFCFLMAVREDQRPSLLYTFPTKAKRFINATTPLVTVNVTNHSAARSHLPAPPCCIVFHRATARRYDNRHPFCHSVSVTSRKDWCLAIFIRLPAAGPLPQRDSMQASLVSIVLRGIGKLKSFPLSRGISALEEILSAPK